MNRQPLLSYKVVGQGPPLVLIHGFGISFSIWTEIIPYLSSHFTLIIPELLGIGRSPMPPSDGDYNVACSQALVTLRHHLSIKQWGVVAYSSGARVAEIYTHLDSQHITQTIYICPAVVTNKFKLVLYDLFLWFSTHFPKIGQYVISQSRLQFLVSLLGFNFTNQQMTTEWQTEISSQPIMLLLRILHELQYVLRKPLQIRDHSSLLIWATNDCVVDYELHQNCTTRFVTGYHSSVVTAGHEIAQLICQFISGGIKYP